MNQYVHFAILITSFAGKTKRAFDIQRGVQRVAKLCLAGGHLWQSRSGMFWDSVRLEGSGPIALPLQFLQALWPSCEMCCVLSELSKPSTAPPLLESIFAVLLGAVPTCADNHWTTRLDRSPEKWEW